MRRTVITPIRLVNWLKAGRGQGLGRDYRPWIQVSRQDHASIGKSSILPNPFIGRQHHLLSGLERAVLILNMAQPCITDIREQYPLWPYPHLSPTREICDSVLDLPTDQWPDSQGTLALAKQLGITHAKFVGLKTPYIYTTDQLLTVKLPNQPSFLVAVSIKYWNDLRGNRNDKGPGAKRARDRKAKFRKLRLEREYWRSLGVPWLLVTDRLVQEQVHRNLEWALSGAIQRFSDNDLIVLKHFIAAWDDTKTHDRCLERIKIISAALSIDTSRAIRLLKFAIMRALIAVDLTQPIHLQLPFPHGEARSPYDIPNWSLLKRRR